MPVIVEDGTMPVGANVFCDVAYIDAFATGVGDAAWLALPTASKERWAIIGAQVVSDGSVYRYDGERQTAEQFMVWPRAGATYDIGGPEIPQSTVPSLMMQANAVAALGLNNGTILLPGSSATPSNRYITQESVGDLSVSYALQGAASKTGGAIGPYFGLGYPAITAIVAPLLDDEFYETQSLTGGVSSAVAARRGPSMQAPRYGGLFNVGMNDYSEDQQTQDGIGGN